MKALYSYFLLLSLPIALILCGIAATVCFCKSLTMGIYCVLLMLALPVMDFMALGKAMRRAGLETEKKSC